jgi:excinuclease ABC subunit B
LERRDVIVVASVSCIYGLGTPEEYAAMTLTLNKGSRKERDQILARLVELQYERNEIGFGRGTFRAKGDTIEIIPAYSENAIRIELFGDEVDRVLELDALTGKLIRELGSITVYPATHFVTRPEKLERALKTISKELEEQLAYFTQTGKLLEAQRIAQRTRYDLEMMRELGYCQGVENYSRHLDGRAPGEAPHTLLDYFPKDYLLIIDEAHQTIPQIRGMYNGDQSRKQVLVDYGFRLPSAKDNRPLKFEEFEARMNQVVYVSATPGPYEKAKGQKIVEQVIRPTGLVDPEVIVRPVKGQIDDILDEVKEITRRGERALLTTLTKKMAEDLTDYLTELGIKARYLHSEIETLDRVEILRDLRLGEFDVLVGINLLREGLDLPEVSFVAILDSDKEGFLRSETSLIQTIGRAARNVRGKVILYADRITDSMQRALAETERRRTLQLEYNAKHGITPQTIKKTISDIVAALSLETKKQTESKSQKKLKVMTPPQMAELIKELELEMYKAAKELQFERAAKIRDEIKELRKELIGVVS